MIIDIHTHVTPKVTVTRGNGSMYCTPEQLLAKMDEAGIDKAVLLPGVSPECDVRRTRTEAILDIVDQYPDRFIPFCCLDPRMVNNSPKSNFMPILEYYKNAGCKGVGELCANMYFDDPLVENMLRQCEEAEMPILFHIGPQFGGCYGLIDDLGLPRLEGTLKKFPGLVTIGHSQAFWSEISADVTNDTRGSYPTGKVIPGRIPELLRDHLNLYGDLSAGSGFNAVSRDPEFGYAFIEEFQDRLMHGTDICAPHNDTPLIRWLRTALEEGNITPEAFEKVTWRNANRVLNLYLE